MHWSLIVYCGVITFLTRFSMIFLLKKDIFNNKIKKMEILLDQFSEGAQKQRALLIVADEFFNDGDYDSAIKFYQKIYPYHHKQHKSFLHFLLKLTDQPVSPHLPKLSAETCHCGYKNSCVGMDPCRLGSSLGL